MQILLLAGFGVFASATTGFVSGLAANYIGHARITFRSDIGRQGFAKFLLVVGVNYILTMIFVHCAELMVGAAIFGKVVSLPFVAANGYFLSKVWVFRK